MMPSLSSLRTRRRHGDADNPTCRARSTFCSRPSRCKARKMRLSIESSVKGIAFQSLKNSGQKMPILIGQRPCSPANFPRESVCCWTSVVHATKHDTSIMIDRTLFAPLDAADSPQPAAAIMLDVLRSEGVRYIFGNPGTTEMPLINSLDGVQDISYVLGLQEASVVAMA